MRGQPKQAQNTHNSASSDEIGNKISCVDLIIFTILFQQQHVSLNVCDSFTFLQIPSSDIDLKIIDYRGNLKCYIVIYNIIYT